MSREHSLFLFTNKHRDTVILQIITVNSYDITVVVTYIHQRLVCGYSLNVHSVYTYCATQPMLLSLFIVQVGPIVIVFLGLLSRWMYRRLNTRVCLSCLNDCPRYVMSKCIVVMSVL